MSAISYPDEKISVPTVIGPEVKIYGPMIRGKREYIRTRVFANHGQALSWASGYLEGQRADQVKRGAE